MIKRILSIDIQKKDEEYRFTLHLDKKVSVLRFNSLSEGFRKITEIVDKHNENLK